MNIINISDVSGRFQDGCSFALGFSFNNKFLLAVLYTIHFTFSAYMALKGVSE